MTTTIHSNGSKWAGQAPDTIERLLEVLAEHDLDLARFGTLGFVTLEGAGSKVDRWKFFGNFADISHGFMIETTDRDVGEPLYEAIRANVKRVCERL